MSSTDRTTTSFLTSAGAHSAGWISSLLLHATLVLGAFVFTQQIKLAPQVTPFRWNVAMVAPASPTAINPSSQSVAPAATPPASPPSLRRSAMTEPAQTTPIAPSSPTPPPTSKQDTLVARPPRVPAIMTPPAPTETVAQERSVVRPVEPAPQSAPAESAPVSASGHPEPRHESLPEIHEPPTPLTTPPSQISHQALVSEPTTAATPIQPIVGQPTPGESVQLESAPAPQVAAMAPVPPSASARLDYSWLSETILRRVEELKRYPAEARLDRAEGKVVLKAVIRGDGSVDDVEVYQSSGYRSLDHAAVELLKQAAPFELPRPLGKSKMTVKIPMSYRLEQ
jgi:periplasmic protein TonB